LIGLSKYFTLDSSSDILNIFKKQYGDINTIEGQQDEKEVILPEISETP